MEVWALVFYWGPEGRVRSVLKFEGTFDEAKKHAAMTIDYQCGIQGRYLHTLDMMPWKKNIPWPE